MINGQLNWTRPLRPEECDIGLAYYNFIEAYYAKNPGKWLTYNM